MGDSSDNIKGVQGIGPKGASRLLSDYKTLDGVYKHLDEIAGVIHNKLRQGKDDAYFSQRLAHIITDVPCNFDLNSSNVKLLDYRGLKQFFEEMEMKSLIRRLDKIIPQDKLTSKDQMSLF